METDRIDDSLYEPQDYQQQRPPSPHYFQDTTPITTPKKSFFDDLDKNVYILIFIAFILGFFMGKTMQPVILRPM